MLGLLSKAEEKKKSVEQVREMQSGEANRSFLCTENSSASEGAPQSATKAPIRKMLCYLRFGVLKRGGLFETRHTCSSAVSEQPHFLTEDESSLSWATPRAKRRDAGWPETLNPRSPSSLSFSNQDSRRATDTLEPSLPLCRFVSTENKV
ncbi:hypothetical protein BKA80DRAFT_256763 [Phyllosticta citrichinensis]